MIEQLPLDKIATFCQHYHIWKLSLFGSILREDFTENSDIDFLVEFNPENIPGLIRLAGMEIELSNIIGRKADLRTAEDLSSYFRQEVINSALEIYAQN